MPCWHKARQSRSPLRRSPCGEAPARRSARSRSGALARWRSPSCSGKRRGWRRMPHVQRRSAAAELHGRALYLRASPAHLPRAPIGATCLMGRGKCAISGARLCVARGRTHRPDWPCVCRPCTQQTRARGSFRVTPEVTSGSSQPELLAVAQPTASVRTCTSGDRPARAGGRRGRQRARAGHWRSPISQRPPGLWAHNHLDIMEHLPRPPVMTTKNPSGRSRLLIQTEFSQKRPVRADRGVMGSTTSQRAQRHARKPLH